MKKLITILITVVLMFGAIPCGAERTTKDYNTEIKQLDRIRHFMLRKYDQMYKTETNTKQIVSAILQIDILIIRLYVDKEEHIRKIAHEQTR